MRFACVLDLPRLVIARILREHPEWSLEDLCGVIESGGPRAAALGEVTIGELLSTEPSKISPTVDQTRLRRAMGLAGPKFDELVFEVLCEAPGPVARSYLLARLGGPRWKMQAALGRLVGAGKVVRTGSTSATRYRAAPSALASCNYGHGDVGV